MRATTNQRRRWGRATAAATGLLLLIAPRLITAAPLDMLAAAPDGQRTVDPSEDSALNFPGSAFFFAQGAFDPAPGAAPVRSAHVLGLDTVAAAPAAMFRGLTPLDSYRALHCLTSAIYYEAGNEPEDGQRAVAQVVLNRARNARWPASVCGVVYEGSERADYRCQFTFSCDGSMTRMPAAAAWVRARRIAQEALAGRVYAPVGLATHYHTLAVHPLWADSLSPVAVIGAHIFYRRPGFDGSAAAFQRAYPGRELGSGPARTVWPVRAVQPVEMMAAGTAMTPAPSMAAIAATPANGPTAAPSQPPAPPQDALPQSTIRPEYRNSGRPLI